MCNLWQTTAFDEQRVAFEKWVEAEKYEQKLRKETVEREKLEKEQGQVKLERELTAQAQVRGKNERVLKNHKEYIWEEGGRGIRISFCKKKKKKNNHTQKRNYSCIWEKI